MSLFFCMYQSSSPNTIYWRQYFLHHCRFTPPLFKYYLNIEVWIHFWALYSVTFIYGLGLFFLKKDFIYLFLERGERKEKEKERNIDVWEMYWLVASRLPPTGDLALNPGMCPDWESNQWPFCSQAGTQSTEPLNPLFSCQYQAVLFMVAL